MKGAWEVLGIEPTSDERAIKRAYAKQLKQTRPEDDAEGFQALRSAYDRALADARYLEQDAADDNAYMRDDCTAPPVVASPAVAATTADVDSSPVGISLNREAPIVAHERDELLRLAWEDAQQVWHLFKETPGDDPVQTLTDLVNRAEMSLLAKDALEVVAGRYCAGDDFKLEVRNACVQYFGWNEDCSHLAHMDGATAYNAMRRYRADIGFLNLRGRPEYWESFSKLLAKEAPNFDVASTRKSFMKEMSDLLRAIQWQYPEVLDFYFNRDVVQWWQDKVNAKKYYVETAALSFVAGVFLIIFVMIGYIQQMNALAFFSVVGLSMGVTMGGGALLAFCPPLQFKEAWHERVLPLLYDDATKMRARYAWLLPFCAAGLVMFYPEPSLLLQITIGLAVFASSGMGMIAASPFLTRQGWMWLVALAAVMTYFMSTFVFPAWHWSIAFMLCVGLQCLINTSEIRAVDWAGIGGGRLMTIRAVWIAGVIAFALLASSAPSSAPLQLALAWLILVLGMFLAQFDLSLYIAWPLFFMIKVMALGQLKLFKDMADQRLPTLFYFLLMLAIFIGSSMYRAMNDPETATSNY